jgi:outer membrane lipoprotein-sorting protein
LSALLLLAGTLPAGAQRATSAPAWGLQPLMASLGQVRASSAQFVETKYLHMLNQVLRSSGRLTYVAPDRLWKETTEPASARLTVIGDHLTIERQGERTRDISLRDYSEVGALVEAVRATLAGDLPALTRHFTTALEGNANAWTLTLAPREPKLLELVTSIRILGERATIRAIETMEADGDRTTMAITPEQR